MGVVAGLQRVRLVGPSRVSGQRGGDEIGLVREMCALSERL